MINLPPKPFEFHGYFGNRRVISFGFAMTTLVEESPSSSHLRTAIVSNRRGVAFVKSPANSHRKQCVVGRGAPLPISVEGTMDEFCQLLERILDRPIVNETNLKGEFEFHVEPSQTEKNNFLDRLRDELGIVIAPVQRNIEILVFDPR